MKICLSEFRYYFSLRGNSGGLHSINMVFKPLYTEGQEPGDLKTEVRHFIDLYMVVLDTLYEDFIDGEKEPMLQDSPYRVDSGYRYYGELPKKKPFTSDKRAAVEQYLRITFGAETVDSHEDIPPYERQEVKLLCSFRKGESRFDDISINIDFQMSHVFNVCFFWFTKRLPGIEIEADARTSLDQLEQTLKATSRRDNMDYYEALTPAGELEQGSG